jgi:hypothetical protein
MADGRLLFSADAGLNWDNVAVPERPMKVTTRENGAVEITSANGHVYRRTGGDWTLTTSPR